MNRSQSRLQGEGGFVLVVALMVMVILSLIGIAGLQTSTFEEQIAGNDWNAKRSFYRAEGGLSMGQELVEQNLACATGFKAENTVIGGTVNVKNLKLSSNGTFDPDSSFCKGDFSGVDVLYPWDGTGSKPSYDYGNLYFGGETQVLPGGALQMAAGYEGLGKSAASGGVAKMFTIYSQYFGPKKSESVLVTGWRHLINSQGDCVY